MFLKSRMATGWQGTYSYRLDQSEEETACVDFEMHLTHGFLGRFRGYVVEGHGGIPERAVVRGRFARNLIWFTKCYSQCWVVDEHGALMAVPDQPPNVVHYSGEVTPDRRRLVGGWAILPVSRVFGGVRSVMPQQTGTWVATAIDEP